MQGQFLLMNTCKLRTVFLKVWVLDQKAVAPSNLLEKQIFRPHARSTDSEILEVGPSNLEAGGRSSGDCEHT